ncbi:hypothetical protein EVAR_92703_1 [Eumeta japonica]|uniref:Uncharacterized protein n=1 Tax=Eumeta variegata TaxID=151549 RepID=A0A4C1SWZ9_EUMVA|nr:hypothetical protein EVAR_92703_1 [Eumeta japonica]
MMTASTRRSTKRRHRRPPRPRAPEGGAGDRCRVPHATPPAAAPPDPPPLVLLSDTVLCVRLSTATPLLILSKRRMRGPSKGPHTRAIDGTPATPTPTLRPFVPPLSFGCF